MNRYLLNEIFYSECTACGCKINPVSYLCNNCEDELPFVKDYCLSCGYPLEITVTYCRNCTSKTGYDNLIIPFWYKGIIKEMLKNIKFRYGFREIFYIKHIINELKLDLSIYDFLMPVPSHFLRKIRRFRHPSDIISDKLSSDYNIKKLPAIKRDKYTRYQWQLKKNMRTLNVKNAFKLKRDVYKLKILLIDDILTSGSTINACAGVLKRNGADRVDCFILSKGVFT